MGEGENFNVRASITPKEQEAFDAKRNQMEIRKSGEMEYELDRPRGELIEIARKLSLDEIRKILTKLIGTEKTENVFKKHTYYQPPEYSGDLHEGDYVDSTKLEGELYSLIPDEKTKELGQILMEMGKLPAKTFQERLFNDFKTANYQKQQEIMKKLFSEGEIINFAAWGEQETASHDKIHSENKDEFGKNLAYAILYFELHRQELLTPEKLAILEKELRK